MEQQNENNSVPVQNESGPVQPGILLREARERLGLSVADAAAQTKLAPRQIEALEADDYQHLPEMAFVRGFVRSYAKVLHLDAQPLLDALPQAKPISTQVSPVSVEVPFPDARSPQLQNLIWLGAALFLSVVAVAVAVWNFTSPNSSAETDHPVEATLPLPSEMHVIPASEVMEASASSVEAGIPAVQSAVPVSAMNQPPSPTVLKQQPVSAVAAARPAPMIVKPVAVSAVVAAKPAPVAAKPVPVSAVPTTRMIASTGSSASASAVKAVAPVSKLSSPAATTQPANLRLTFGEESWTEVRDRNGNIVSSQLNPAGSELRLSGQGPYTLVVGRATAARLTYKGKTVDMKPYTNTTSDVARLMLE